MIPRSLKLSNFGSFRGEHKIDFDFNLGVFSGPNGAGKSTLAVDSILFALFGTTRAGNLDSIITEDEEVARVEFEFGVGDDIYLVSRQRSNKGGGKSTLSFQMADPDGPGMVVLDGKTARETQQKIEQTTRLTDDLLCATAFASQGDADRFSRAGPADRKGVLNDILGLGEYEVLARAARDQQRGLEAETEAKGRAREQAEAIAAGAEQLETDIKAVGVELEGLGGQLRGVNEGLEAVGKQREELVKAQTEDEAARRGLTALAEQIEKGQTEVGAAQRRLGEMEGATKDKDRVLALVKESQAAETQAQEHESKRQEQERLEAEARPITEKIKAAKDAHAREVEALETAVNTAKREHERDVTALREGIAGLEKRTGLLDGVPCADTPMAERCLLIEDAMGARALLPTKQRDLQGLEGKEPWADKERELAALREQVPWADLCTEREELKRQFDAIEYDAEAHTQAKEQAGDLAKHREALTRVEAAEEQLPDANEQWTAIVGDLDALKQKHTTLSGQLGDARNWANELAVVDEKKADLTRQQAQLTTDTQAANQRKGALERDLEAARKAAEEVAELRVEIKQISAQAARLRVLGNPHDGALSRNGIPALLIEQAVPELEAAANEVLTTLSDGRMALELRTQVERKSSNSVSETLDIVVHSQKGPRLYEMWSGGQKTRLNIALRAGLTLVLARQAGARCGMFVLDEPDWLDERGQDELVECLGRLAEHFPIILLVTHIERLKDAFPTRLEVSWGEENDSRVEVVA